MSTYPTSSTQLASANIAHAGSVSFFRSNQLLSFAEIALSATDAALDARD